MEIKSMQDWHRAQYTLKFFQGFLLHVIPFKNEFIGIVAQDLFQRVCHVRESQGEYFVKKNYAKEAL